MTARAFHKILIANRGEIAVRIARSARAMGYATVAVYSDADAGAFHLAAADEAVRIGPAPAAESYLDIPALIAAARRAGADAVHPGYGFLSENAGFATACDEAGLVFVGPPAAAIAAMGNKAAAKRRMNEAGVACVPGYQGADQSDARLCAEAGRIGFPVMVKAAAGGGGRGMRHVASARDIAAAIVGARSEAQSAFGSGELIIEKAVADARHIEIQIFADDHGNVIHLGERDCSVQRRHQKVIEEAPSPAVGPELRAKMGAAAVAAARSIGYRGAGTVEFLLGGDGQFYFLEMNTRLQVEHPVTEAITGLDLVEWQLRVARGEPLPLAQDQVTAAGHAIEVRLYAEAPAQGFLPQSGPVLHWHGPHGPGIRVDHGLRTVDQVSPYYDPMLAKIIAHGATREEARNRLVRALDATVVLGIETNRAFLAAMLRHPEFAAGRATTAFIGQHFAPGSSALAPPPADQRLQALAAVLLLAGSGEWPQGPLAGWSSTAAASAGVHLKEGANIHVLDVRSTRSGRYAVRTPQGDVAVAIEGSLGGTGAVADIDGSRRPFVGRFGEDGLHLQMGGRSAVFRDVLRDTAAREAKDGAGRLLAPMNGRVVRVLAERGDTVAKGQCVVILEAMKMQHEIAAGRAGRIAALNVAEGQQVATRTVLAELVEDQNPR